MSNPARDLLNFVDDHKTEMKDDTYKGIVDKITPINKICEEKNKSRYKVIFQVIFPIYEDDDTHELEMNIEQKEFFLHLSTQEVKIINKWLDDFGTICRFHPFDVETYQGINVLDQIRMLLTKHRDTLSIRYDIDSRVAISCSNEVFITRVKKCRQ